METVSRFIGLDVHKSSITAAWAPAAFTGVRDVSAAVTMPAEDGKLLSYLAELGTPSELVVGYEAGPTGYGLCRRLRRLGYSCIVMAPTREADLDGETHPVDRVAHLRPQRSIARSRCLLGRGASRDGSDSNDRPPVGDAGRDMGEIQRRPCPDGVSRDPVADGAHDCRGTR